MAGYTTEQIRNVAITGPAGSGKTTLIEQMLFTAGAIGAIGTVEGKDTVCDFDDLEKEIGRSLDSALVNLDHGGAHVNIIDTPGSAEFLGKSISVLPGVETVIVVIDAESGIDTVSRRVMKIASERNLPRMIVINKIDHGGDVSALLDNIQETFGTICQPINLPTGGGTGVIDCFKNTEGESDLGDVSDFHEKIVDQVVEVDDDLMAKYLEEGSVSPEELHGPFEMALREAHLVPICFAAGREGIGVNELLNNIIELCPNPKEGNPRAFISGDGTKIVPTYTEGPLLAHVFKVSSDPYVGKLSVFKVHQGHVSSQSQPRVDDERKPIRVTHIFRLAGAKHDDISTVVPGDIGAVAKIDELHFNSIIHDGSLGESIHLKALVLPRPMFGLAIQAASKNAEGKLGESLQKLLDEDPTLEIERVSATGQLVLRGLGDIHLKMKLRILKDRYGVDVTTEPPKVAYKETITMKAEGHHRHKKQSGGAGQFGEVFLRVEPMEKGGEEPSQAFEFVDDTFGGSIPKQFLPAIEKGIRRKLVEGAIAGYPMQDIRVSVYDGKYHAVDSKEVAFMKAGAAAFVDTVQKAKPTLLEPFVVMEITVNQDLIGDIASDISGKRGRINATDMLAGGQALIHAEAPLSEVMNYANQLKSISGGAGSFAMEYSHDEQTPAQVQAEVVAAFKPKDDED